MEYWFTVALAPVLLFVLALVFVFKRTAVPDVYAGSKYVMKLKVAMAVSLVIPVVLFFLVFVFAYELGGYYGLVAPVLVMAMVLEYARSHGRPEPYFVSVRQSPELHNLFGDVSESMEIQKNFEIALCRGCKAYTFGWLKPKVVLGIPLFDHLTVAELRSVIAHELGHVKNKDYAIGTFFTLVNISFESAFKICKHAILASGNILFIIFVGIAAVFVWLLKGFLRAAGLLFLRQREFLADIQTTLFEVEDEPTSFKRSLAKTALLNIAEREFLKQILQLRIQAVRDGKLPISGLLQTPHLNRFYEWMRYVGFSLSDDTIERVLELKPSDIGRWRSWAATHPLTTDRVHNLQALMANHPSQSNFSPTKHDDSKAISLLKEIYNDAVKFLYGP